MNGTDRRIVVEFTDGRRFDNLVARITGKPEDEVLADLGRGIQLMRDRGFKPTGTRTFQAWSPEGWVRMGEEEVHRQPARIAGFAPKSAFLR